MPLPKYSSSITNKTNGRFFAWMLELKANLLKLKLPIILPFYNGNFTPIFSYTCMFPPSSFTNTM